MRPRQSISTLQSTTLVGTESLREVSPYSPKLTNTQTLPVLGSSTTQLFRNLSQTLNFSHGDEIIVSKIDHEANIASWVDLAERQKLVLKWWLPSQASLDASSPKLEVADLKDLLSDKTRLVTLTHASNILGTIHDVKAVSDAVHAQKDEALVCVDGVAYAPHRPIDVKALGGGYLLLFVVQGTWSDSCCCCCCLMLLLLSYTPLC